MINHQMKGPGHLAGAGRNPLTLIDLLRSRADDRPDNFAYTFLDGAGDEQARLTYTVLDQQAKKIGARLQSLITPGERVLLLYPPGLDYITAFFGCLYAGAVAVPAYPPTRNRNMLRLRSIVIDSQSAVALTTDHLLGRIMPLVSQDSHLTKLGWLSTDTMADGDESVWRPPSVSTAPLALLQYTSGPTSVPQ